MAENTQRRHRHSIQDTSNGGSDRDGSRSAGNGVEESRVPDRAPAATTRSGKQEEALDELRRQHRVEVETLSDEVQRLNQTVEASTRYTEQLRESLKAEEEKVRLLRSQDPVVLYEERERSDLAKLAATMLPFCTVLLVLAVIVVTIVDGGNLIPALLVAAGVLLSLCCAFLGLKNPRTVFVYRKQLPLRSLNVPLKRVRTALSPGGGGGSTSGSSSLGFGVTKVSNLDATSYFNTAV